MAKKCIELALVKLLNVATEPLTLGEIARQLFGRELPGTGHTVMRYDFRSRHAALWKRQDGYLYGREQVQAALRSFIESMRTPAGGRR